MVKYSAKPLNPAKSVKAKGADLRVSFKNTHATAAAIRKMSLERAKAYLTNVLKHQECIPFRRFNGGIGRCAQAKQFKTSQGRWPAKSVKFLYNLLINAESNAQFKGLEPENMIVKHVAVHRACQMRRRTYRAHGRINPFMSTPCHIEMILEEKAEKVEKPETKKKKRNRMPLSTFKPTAPKVKRTYTYSAKKRELIKKDAEVVKKSAPKKTKAVTKTAQKAKPAKTVTKTATDGKKKRRKRQSKPAAK